MVIRRWAGLPVAALTAAASIFLFETSFVWQYRHHFWDANYILLEKKRERLTQAQKPDDIAILGSSRFYHLQPGAIADLVGNGARVSNYSWAYCGVEAYESMLRGLLTAGRAPRTILVDGCPEICSFPSRLLTARDSEEYRTRLAVTVPFRAGIQTAVGQNAWNVAWDLFAYHVTPPSTVYREKVKAGLTTLLKTRELPPLPPNYENFVGNWLEQGWFYFALPERVAGPEDFQMLENATGPPLLRDNASVAASYERFVQLADANNINIIMLAVPTNPRMYQGFQEQRVFEKYDGWLTDLERMHSNFVAPGPRWMVWPGLLGDAGHVNAAGAKKHMDFVLELLGRPAVRPYLK